MCSSVASALRSDGSGPPDPIAAGLRACLSPAPRGRACPGSVSTYTEEFWALRDLNLKLEAGEGARNHREERRRQVHALENPEPDHGAHRGANLSPRPGGQFAQVGNRSFIPN